MRRGCGFACIHVALEARGRGAQWVISFTWEVIRSAVFARIPHGVSPRSTRISGSWPRDPARQQTSRDEGLSPEDKDRHVSVFAQERNTTQQPLIQRFKSPHESPLPGAWQQQSNRDEKGGE